MKTGYKGSFALIALVALCLCAFAFSGCASATKYVVPVELRNSVGQSADHLDIMARNIQADIANGPLNGGDWVNEDGAIVGDVLPLLEEASTQMHEVYKAIGGAR